MEHVSLDHEYPIWCTFHRKIIETCNAQVTFIPLQFKFLIFSAVLSDRNKRLRFVMLNDFVFEF